MFLQGASAFSGAKVIDCHSHLLPEGYVQGILEAAGRDESASAGANRFRTGFRERYPLAVGHVTERLALMDSAGIDLQIVTVGSPHIFPDDPGLRRDLVRLWNDGVDDVVRANPDRFRQYVSLPLPDVQSSLQELERVWDRASTAGVRLYTHLEGIPIDDARWNPIYDVLNSLAATVFIHPDGFCVRGLLDDHFMNWDVGTQFDDVIATIRLYHSVVPKWPEIRWIIPHLGGALPFLLGRLDHHWERDQDYRTLASPPSDSLRNLTFDTAGHGQASVRFAIETLGADRLVLGSDFPMIWADDLAPPIDFVARACQNEAERDAILGKNASRLLKWPAQART